MQCILQGCDGGRVLIPAIPSGWDGEVGQWIQMISALVRISFFLFFFCFFFLWWWEVGFRLLVISQNTKSDH